jgi:predicted aspartyl protease
MNAKGANGVGRFSIEFEVANNDDLAAVRLGLLDRAKVRRLKVQGVVDSGPAQFVLPKSVVRQLGLPITGRVKVRYADGRRATREAAEGAYVEIGGRHAIFNAIVEPKRESALIGAIVLEALDLLVDCTRQRLVPRDPKFVVTEIE